MINSSKNKFTSYGSVKNASKSLIIGQRHSITFSSFSHQRNIPSALSTGPIYQITPANMIYRYDMMKCRGFSTKPNYDESKLQDFFSITQETVSKTVKSTLSVVKGSLLEIFSRRLPEHDKEYLAEKWGFNKANEPVSSPPAAAVEQVVTAPTIAAALVPAEPVSAPMESAAPVVVEAPAIEHPIFGTLAADVGYKKVYRTNVEALAYSPVWEKNRILRPERAKLIANSKIKNSSSNEMAMPGVITLYHNTITDKYGIVDGQHRAACLVSLASDGYWDMTRKNVIIDVFEVSSDQQVSDLFKEINSSEPVRLVDMPEDGASDEVRDMLVQVTDSLSGKYPEMFKPSTRCRPPHLNVDNLRDELFQYDYLKRHKLTSSDMIIEHLEKVNKNLGKMTDKQWLGQDEVDGLRYSATESSLKKARAHKFYLGLDKTWISK
jgi:hypothetical protein